MSHSSGLPVPGPLQKIPAPFLGALKKLTGFESLNEVYRAATGTSSLTPSEFAAGTLAALGTRSIVDPKDVERIPTEGACVVVANHPFGILEGVLLTDLLNRIRPDFKFLVNGFLMTVPELQQILIPVDVFSTGEKAALANRKPIAEALAWLRGGGMLVVFPSGVVSTWDWRANGVTDPPWNTMVARLAGKTAAPVVPMYFCGTNSVPFHLVGLIHPTLRTMRLPAEFANKRGLAIEIRVGSPIKPKELAEAGATPDEQTAYLRSRSYLLGYRHSTKPAAAAPPPPKKQMAAMIGKGVNPTELEAEIGALDPEQRLDSSGAFDVYTARTRQMPAVLTEIGRLRELTFRLAGEGTGRSTDLDSFDSYYDHIFVWQREKRELVGAYRLTRTTPVIEWRGIRGLYTSTVFRYRPDFFRKLGPAIELGRSFVRPEYQKEYAPLVLLWKGIARYAALHAGYPILFGAVSISGDYSPAARQLMVEYLSRQGANDPLRFHVRPRNPFRPPLLGGAELKRVAGSLCSLDSLSTAVSEIDAGGRGIPVLLRQYAKLGGRVLNFAVDKEFSGTLDGLILVDLRKTETATLKRYMGPAGLARFAAAHNQALSA